MSEANDRVGLQGDGGLGAAWWLGLPCGLFALYLAAMVALPDERVAWLYSESGPLEWAQVVLFGAAGVLALRLSLRPGPGWARACYAGFGVVGLLVVGEELSWGQHLLGFDPPDTLANKQDELNLHNLLDDLPSRLMRRFLEIGLPILCVVLPVVELLRGPAGYRVGGWPWRLLPRWEAMPALGLAALGRPLKDSDEWGLPLRWSESSSEYAELFWATAILIWILTLSRRIGAGERREAPVVDEPR